MAPHIADHGYGDKPALPAMGMLIGTAVHGSHEAVTVILDGQQLPWALQHTLSATEARDIAAALIEAAGVLEGPAAAQAAAALAKAAGK